MVHKRVIPCLQIINRKLVKTTRFDKPVYIGDPVNAIKIFNEKEVDEIIVIDIRASREKRQPDLEMIRSLTDECFMPFTYGGGVTSISQMKEIFSLGAEKIILNSVIFSDPGFVKKASETFGAQSIVVSADLKKDFWGKWRPAFLSGSVKSGLTAIEFIRFAESSGAGEIILHNIEREGTWKGFDPELLKNLSDITSVPVIAMGGANSIENVRMVLGLENVTAVALGSMAVFQNKFQGVLINFPDRNMYLT